MTVTFITITTWTIFYILDYVFDLMPLLSGSGIAVIHGEYYRMFTGVLLHGNLIHLVVNCAAMFWLGYDLEKEMGSVRFLLFSFAAVMLTQAAYYFLLPEINNAFGGSGLTYTYIGLIAALQILHPSTPRFPGNMKYGTSIFIYAVLGNLPLFPSMNFTTILLHGTALAVGFALTFLFFHSGSAKNNETNHESI